MEPAQFRTGRGRKGHANACFMSRGLGKVGSGWRVTKVLCIMVPIVAPRLPRPRDVGPAIAFRAPRHRYRTPCWDNLKNLGFAIDPPANPVRPTLRDGH